MSKTSIDRKINKQQKQNSMGKILIYLHWKDVLLIKSSKFSILKNFSMSVVWNIWWISPFWVNVYSIVSELGQMDLFRVF